MVATSYIFARRGEVPENGRVIERGTFDGDGLVYFGKNRWSFSARRD